MPTVFGFEAIGTKWQIEITDALSADQEGDLLRTIRARIERFEATYSRFRENSLVKQASKQPGRYVFPEDAAPLLALYRDLSRLTQGAFTPIMGTLLEEAGYDAHYSLKAGKLHHLPPLDEALMIEGSVLTVKQPVLLDFGAAGKGYLIDLVSDLLQTTGIRSYSIDAGGDILHRDVNDKPLRIGLENPANIQQAIGVATILNKSICGSAGNRRKWGKFHHIINPNTLTSPTNVLATWVVADSTMLADALATCLFFVSHQELATQYSFESLVLTEDFTVVQSPGFPAELFLE